LLGQIVREEQDLKKSKAGNMTIKGEGRNKKKKPKKMKKVREN
jgi:hypothetical protein